MSFFFEQKFDIKCISVSIFSLMKMWLKRQNSENNEKNVILGKSANIRLLHKVNFNIKTIQK